MPAKALPRAAGLLKCHTKLRKKSTATERATSASSTASEHAPAACTDDVYASTSELQKTIEEDLENIVALLLWMAQDFRSNIHRNDIHCEAFEVLIKHVGEAGGTLGSLHTGSVAKLSKLIDIMMLHKDGSRKDANATLAFMRRVGKFARKYEPHRATMLQSVSNRATMVQSVSNRATMLQSVSNLMKNKCRYVIGNLVACCLQMIFCHTKK